MSILLDETTRVVVQGATGQVGAYHTRLMLEYGTRIVAGVTPGRGGTAVEGVPIYDTVAGAMEKHDIDFAVQFVPGRLAKEAVFEAADAGIRTIACISEGMPIHDMMTVKRRLRGTGITLVGPNTNGIMSPGRAKAGMFAAQICSRGPVGIASKSGSLSHTTVLELRRAGLGQSTIVGIGGDPILGISFIDCIKRFEMDPETKAILLLGEIGGEEEEEAAAYVEAHPGKPIVALIAGKAAPTGVSMGHAGAIVLGEHGSRASKLAAYRAAGIPVAETLLDVPALLIDALRTQRNGSR